MAYSPDPTDVQPFRTSSPRSCRAAPWVNFGGSVIMEAEPCDAGEGSSNEDLTQAKNSSFGLARYWPWSAGQEQPVH